VPLLYCYSNERARSISVVDGGLPGAGVAVAEQLGDIVL
jgi:hypothetical protein